MATAYIEDREVIRLWLKQRYEGQGFNTGRLAAALRVSRAAVSKWLADTPVPSKYWDGLARYFEYATPMELLTDAREAAVPSRRRARR